MIVFVRTFVSLQWSIVRSASPWILISVPSVRRKIRRGGLRESTPATPPPPRRKRQQCRLSHSDCARLIAPFALPYAPHVHPSWNIFPFPLVPPYSLSPQETRACDTWGCRGTISETSAWRRSGGRWRGTWGAPSRPSTSRPRGSRWWGCLTWRRACRGCRACTRCA